jgi:hypothetical protein
MGGVSISQGAARVAQPVWAGSPGPGGRRRPHVFGADAAREAEDAEQLASTVEAYLRHATGEKGKQVVEKNRGALDALVQIIGGYLD